MTRKELLARARAEGAAVKHYQLVNAILTGKLPEPKLIGPKLADYTEEHLHGLVKLFGARQPEVAAK